MRRKLGQLLALEGDILTAALDLRRCSPRFLVWGGAFSFSLWGPAGPIQPRMTRPHTEVVM